MMCVIVDDDNVSDVSFYLKAAVCAGKCQQSAGDLFHGQSDGPGTGDGCQGIHNIVGSFYFEADMSQFFSADNEGIGTISFPVIGNVLRGVVVFCAHTEGNDLLGKAFYDIAGVFHVAVDDDLSVRRCLGSENVEGMFDVIDIFEEIHVIFFYI